MHLGIDVYRPLNDGTRCDLIFDLAGKLMRVQGQVGASIWRRVDHQVLPMSENEGWFVDTQLHRDEVDAFAAYSMDLDKCFFLPFEVMQGRNTVQLRLAPSKNNQQA
jgi:hypothetical protein